MFREKTKVQKSCREPGIGIYLRLLKNIRKSKWKDNETYQYPFKKKISSPPIKMWIDDDRRKEHKILIMTTIRKHALTRQ